MYMYIYIYIYRWVSNNETVFAFVFFEVKKMKLRKFEIIYICLRSHQNSVQRTDTK